MRADVTTILGILIGIGCIVLGQSLEGGSVDAVLQLTAAVIVFGGTAGAVVTQFPLDELRLALRQTRWVFASERQPLEPLIAEMVELGRVSRREGLLAIETEAEKRSADPFVQRALQALVDGTETSELRGGLENRIEQEEQRQLAGPRMFEAAGGYAPTIGILGAVLGLIHVMENLSEPSRLGAGIAVAFVATVYGVGSANLLFLPFAQKLRTKVRESSVRKELIVDAVCAIQEGLNPSLLERRLESYLAQPGSGGRRA